MTGSGGRGSLERVCILLVVTLISCLPASKGQSSPPSSASADCPLDFTLLNQYTSVANYVKSSVNNKTLQCNETDEGLQAVVANYLKSSGYFLIPNGTSTACVNAYQTQLQSQGVPNTFNLSTSCPLDPLFSERGTDLCHNIQSAQDFRNFVPASTLANLNSSCSGSLSATSVCGRCETAISNVLVNLNGSGIENNSCSAFANIYTLAEVNIAGPKDPTTLLCILYMYPISGGTNDLKFIAVGVGGMLVLCTFIGLVFFCRWKRRRDADREARKKRTKDVLFNTSVPNSSIHWFDIDEIKRATNNFNYTNLLGTGGWGNVYKGTLSDGTLVAVKRFKNCAPAGDKDFVHEVEMISSVKHSHLVEIRGCCVHSSPVQGHQRIIVYDLMPNGSLEDHLFWKGRNEQERVNLNWSTRRKIAIGMAKGLSYLHNDAVPAIFHRDIKPPNILLDENWNARLGDFGLAKFTPEGVSHVTTKVAGTKGYLAPEYWLLGQVTEKSDVYSFGMVILELLTGRKALSATENDMGANLLADVVGPLVKQGRWRDIVDPRMGDDMGSDEEVERFFVVGLLCAHPILHFRPSIGQALKMLESGSFPAPPLPDRPLPVTSTYAEIQEALSRESQGNSRRTGYSSFSLSSVSSLSSESFHSSFHGRILSSERIADDISVRFLDAQASLPEEESPDRAQDTSTQFSEATSSLLSTGTGESESPDRRGTSTQFSDATASLPGSVSEEKESPDRTQDSSTQFSEATASVPSSLSEIKESPDRIQDSITQFSEATASLPPSFSERTMPPDRIRDMNSQFPDAWASEPPSWSEERVSPGSPQVSDDLC